MRCAQLFQVFRLAGGDDFDLAVIGVADPAAQAKLGGFAMDEPAKADALHAASMRKCSTIGTLSVAERNITTQPERPCQ